MDHAYRIWASLSKACIVKVGGISQGQNQHWWPECVQAGWAGAPVVLVSWRSRVGEEPDICTKQSLSGDIKFLQMWVLRRKPGSSKDTIRKTEERNREWNLTRKMLPWFRWKLWIKCHLSMKQELKKVKCELADLEKERGKVKLSK